MGEAGDRGPLPRRVGLALGFALACAVLIGSASSPTTAQEWGGLDPGQGAPGTRVTLAGNLIGCYGSGPGQESATWGIPERVAIYFDTEVRDSAQADAFARELTDDPNGVLSLQELDSHSFGEAGWELSFSVPNARPGTHLVVLSFQPQCNNRSVERPNGFTQAPSNAFLSFCITQDGVCPAGGSTLPSGGRDVGGGVTGIRTGRGSVDVLGGQIRTNILIGSLAVAGIIAVLAIAAAAAAAASAASAATTTAIPAAAAPVALPAAAATTGLTLAAGETVVPGCAYTVTQLLNMTGAQMARIGISSTVRTIRAAMSAFNAGRASATQIELLKSAGLLL